jgi:putative salt-induced outer membrane protein YdiY
MILTTTLPLALFAAFSGNGANEPERTNQPLQDQEPAWHGKADLGYTFLSGNSESTTAALNAELRYDADMYSWLFNAHYAGVRTTDRTTGDAQSKSRLYSAAGQYNHFMDEDKNLYAYGNANVRKDVPVGLDLRWTIGAGAGYTWYLNTEKDTLFSLEGGPAYFHEENVGSTDDVDALAGRVAARYENPLWTEWLLTATGEFLQSFDESADKTFVGEMNLSWNFRADWYFKATTAVAWDNTPAAGFESTDRRIVLSVGHSF